MARGDKLDVIIFGATGFTGKFVVSAIVSIAKEKNISWGISGRNQTKLEEVLKEESDKSGESLAAIPIILADVKDDTSLQQMAARAHVVINCVGPFRFFGDAVVKACIISGAHYVDINAEPQFAEKMQLVYHKAAEDKGVYIVCSCGSECISSDMGTVFLMNEHKGDLNTVEIYLEYFSPVKGPLANIGTWESTVHAVRHISELRTLREKLHPTPLPKFTPKLTSRFPIHRKEGIAGWCVPNPACDNSVLSRSQRYFYEHEKLRPAQIGAYAAIPSFFTLMLIFMVLALNALFIFFEWGRNLLLKYPRFFTAGFMSLEGPTQEVRENLLLSLTFFGDGWSERLAEPTDQHDSPPNKKVIVKVSGKDPGYGLTGVMVVLSAITVLKESDKMPSRGGVYTTGAAFSKTSLIEELNKHGLKFEVLSVIENAEK